MFREWDRDKKLRMAGKAAKTAAGVSVGAAKSGVDLFKNTRGVFYRQKDFSKPCWLKSKRSPGITPTYRRL